MSRLNLSVLTAAILLGSVAWPQAGADDRAARASAGSFDKKLTVMRRQSTLPRGRTLETKVTEQEVNGYLLHGERVALPSGVVSPAVSILGSTGRISGRAVVDLDRVRKERKATSWLDPVSYLTGRLPVTATGVLSAKNGVGQFTFQSATVGGVPVPKMFVQQLVSYYSRSADRPSGIDIDQPFTLPAHIREIRLGRGEATIVQQ